MAEQPPKRNLKVKIDDTTAQGTYANLAMVSHAESEFVLDFMFLQPGRDEAKVGARIIVSPIQAKRLLAALGENIGRFEKRFGPIPVVSGPPTDPILH